MWRLWPSLPGYQAHNHVFISTTSTTWHQRLGHPVIKFWSIYFQVVLFLVIRDHPVSFTKHVNLANTLDSYFIFHTLLFLHLLILFIQTCGLLLLVLVDCNIIFYFSIITLTIFGYIHLKTNKKLFKNFSISPILWKLNFGLQLNNSNVIMVVNILISYVMTTLLLTTLYLDFLVLTPANKTGNLNAWFVLSIIWYILSSFTLTSHLPFGKRLFTWALTSLLFFHLCP